jgi:hypothetical protein
MNFCMWLCSPFYQGESMPPSLISTPCFGQSHINKYDALRGLKSAMHWNILSYGNGNSEHWNKPTLAFWGLGEWECRGPGQPPKPGRNLHWPSWPPIPSGVTEEPGGPVTAHVGCLNPQLTKPRVSQWLLFKPLSELLITQQSLVVWRPAYAYPWQLHRWT